MARAPQNPLPDADEEPLVDPPVDAVDDGDQAGADPVGAGDPADLPPAATTDPLDPAVLSAELARARRDAANYREQRNTARSELEEAQREVARLTAEIGGARRFELSAAAAQAGLIRPEDLEFMVDQSGLDRLLDEADPTRRAELINEFIENVRQDRPHWFDPHAASMARAGLAGVAAASLGIPRGPGAAPLPKVTPGFSAAIDRAMNRRTAA